MQARRLSILAMRTSLGCLAWASLITGVQASAQGGPPATSGARVGDVQNAAAALDAAGARSAPQSPDQTTGSASAGTIDDIVVTAQKKNRGERLQDVPIAISAFGPQQLDQAKFKDLTDLAIRAPGVALAENGGQRGIASSNIRGLGTNSTSPSVEPAVGVFVDGVYLGTNYGVILDTFDLEGVEILRGPQGTLQGRNVTGGAVLLRTRRPGDTFSVRGQASLETGPEYNIAGSVEGPLLGGAVRAKIAAYYDRDEGWFKNPTLGRDMGRQTTWFVRPTIVIEPVAGLDETVIFERGRIRGDGAVFQRIGRFEALGTRGFENLQDEPGYTSIDWTSVTSETNLRVGLGNGVITNIFNYRSLENGGLADYDGGVGRLYHNYVYLDQDQRSNELRYAGQFGKLDLTVGLFYFDQNYFYLERRIILNGVINRTYGGTIHQKSGAVFAQGEYHFSDRLSLTLGGRYSGEKKRAEIYLLPAAGNVSSCNFDTRECNGTVPPIYRDSHSWSSFTPKISINYKPEPGVLLYATASKGVRNGGYNVRSAANAASPAGVVPAVAANTRPAASPLYDVEDQWAYEAGFKADLFGRLVRWNTAAFYNDLRGLQRDAVQVTGSGIVTSLTNATDANIYGFESELTVNPTRELQLNGSVAYVNVDYKNVIFDLSGDGVINSVDFALEPPRAAHWQYNLGASYTRPLNDEITFSGNVNFAYRGRAPSSDDNRYFLTTRNLLTASLTLSWPGDRFSISAYGKNLLNDDNEGFAIDAGAALGYVLRPIEEGRVIGVEGRFRF